MSPPAAAQGPVQAKRPGVSQDSSASRALEYYGIVPPATPDASPSPVQRKEGAQAAPAEPSKNQAERVHEAAALGTSGPGGTLPYLAEIQRSFGRQDVSHIQAHTDSRAAESARAMGAEAFTTGEHVAFAGPPSLHTAAHEAAHVIQQRAGVQLKGRVGEVGDRYEQHADAVADLVVQGKSAEGLLAQMGPASIEGRSPDGGLIQRQVVKPADPMEKLPGTLWATGPDGKPLPPSLDDISQGGLSDCFLFAAMAAIINTDPQRLVKAIKDNGDGTYTVTFKGLGMPSDQQTVSAEFVVDKHGNVTKTKALWPLIIEKAYAQAKGGLDQLDKGGNPGDAVKDLTKQGPDRFDPQTKNADDILAQLQMAKDKKWPATVLGPNKDGASKEKQELADKIPGLKFWHAYTVVDVDVKGKKVKLFNPWGHDHPNKDGWLEIEHFRTFFIEVDINK